MKKVNHLSIQANLLGKTYITRSYPFGLNRRNGHRLLCSDGKIRAAELAESPDTFFSTPARIRINGKTVTGYMTIEETWNDDKNAYDRVYSFRHHNDQGEKHSLPAWDDTTVSWEEKEKKKKELILSAL